MNKVTRMIMHYFEWRSTGKILGIVKKYILLHQEEFYVENITNGSCMSFWAKHGVKCFWVTRQVVAYKGFGNANPEGC